MAAATVHGGEAATHTGAGSTAVHEAGHATMAFMLDRGITRVTVVPDDDAGSGLSLAELASQLLQGGLELGDHAGRRGLSQACHGVGNATQGHLQVSSSNKSGVALPHILEQCLAAHDGAT